MSSLGHLVGMVGTAVISLSVAWWVRQQTRDHAGTVMVLLLLSHAAMAILASGHILADGRTLQIAFFQLRYLLGLFGYVLWLLLAVYYTGRSHWLTRPVWAILLGLPIGIGVLWLTDGIHGQMVAEYHLQTRPFTYVRPEYTTLSFALVSTLFFFPIFSFGLFLRQFLFSRRSYRWHTGAVVVGMAAVFASTSISESSIVSAPGFAYGVYGSAVFGVVVALALFRTKLFAVLPLARDAVLESMDDAILIVDGDHRIVDYNATTLDLFPDVDDRLDESIAEAYPALVVSETSRNDGPQSDGGGAQAIVDRVEGALDSPFAGTIEVTVDGDTRRLRVSVSEIRSGGEPRGYALVMSDVTELEAYTTELEEKTAELEAKTRKLEQFASVLSHDLRNPVAVATGYVEHAIDTGDVDHAEEALGALERMDATIENLLALSRQGETIDDPDVVALAPVVDDAWETSDTHDATLSNEVPADYRCRTDPERLQTLFENCFRNAVDHGGDAVRVGLHEDGFFVADDGPGIPADERARVFEYGYTTAEDGTGLGLAIVEAVADAHGWALRMTESQRGGARVEVEGIDVVDSVTEPAPN